ncbi:DUF6884 domain-containing protein [Natrinema hispanicum]|uniref:DUF6884 domain-containing protein n=1 Tax=Natrinema hispanicum TaxID=392421 RepID=A0A1G6UYL0_9EURY|nr:DUF6884 domain-containing protein [Natrinema hispanicum]SDD46480.1 hypothetical protein SAMN05192552_102429 [Natrinema hispanicum]
MTEIGLVSCTKTKREHAAPPAKLYSPSALFSKARQYCELYHDDWYILSAKHQLLKPDRLSIEPYDETLTGARVARKREWSQAVYEELKEAGLLESNVTLVFHAGKAYYEELLPLLEDHDVTIEISTEGLLIGERLSWYNQRL